MLQNLGRMKEFDVTKWVDDSYIRKAYAELKLDYDADLKSFGELSRSRARTSSARSRSPSPSKAGEVWVDGEGHRALQQRRLALGAMPGSRPRARRSDMAYVFDAARGIKLFADSAFLRYYQATTERDRVLG